ncbi:MAG: tetratricopeptide repeat protein [Saprospirales bacterium]|nr:tetratricopeptide repeat protein [Saprospirales bacterium]
MKKISLLLAFLSLAIIAGAQSVHDHLRSGDQAYKGQDYVKAEEEYRKALEKKPTAQGEYNLGSSIYEQQRFEEALQQFERAAGQATDPTLRANAYHNLGNTYYSNQQYQEAVDAYKNALRIQPADAQTQYNLSQALRQLQLQQQQQQQQQNQEQKEQNQEEQSKEQDQSGQPQEQEGPPPPDQEEQDQSQSEQAPQPGEQQHGTLSDEEAERLLDIMDREEQKVQEKMRRAEGKPTKPAKDW